MVARAAAKTKRASVKAKARATAEAAGDELTQEQIEAIVAGTMRVPSHVSRKTKRKIRMLKKQAKLGVDVDHAVGQMLETDTRTDEEILEDIQRRFQVLRRLSKKAKQGTVRFVIAPGATGIGKSYNVDEEMAEPGTVFTRVSGTISDIELYKLAYCYRFPGNVIVIDDGDKVFKNEGTLNLLKHMTDTRKQRVLTWKTNSEFLFMDNPTKGEPAIEVEREFEYQGSVIVLSNKDFQGEIDAQRGSRWEHMEALMGRGYYLDLRVHNRKAISLWVNYVATQGKMFEKEGIDEKNGKIILDWMEKHRAKLRGYSLREVKKLCDLIKGAGGWTAEVQEEAETTLLR